MWFAVFILLAPATGKSLSCGQRIRITGISPLRGSLRAVSGSTIIILAVFAYMRSCLMVCDGILAPPSVTPSGAGGSWRTSQAAITRTDVSVLAYSIVNVQQRFPKRSLYYICNGRGQIMPPSLQENFLLSSNADNNHVFWLP